MTKERITDPYKRFCAFMAILYAQGHTNAAVAQLLGVHERTLYKWLSKQRPVGPLLLGALENLATKRSG